MTGNLTQLFQTHVVPLLGKALERIAGQTAEYLLDDERYDKHVITPAWGLMPLPVRMIGRKRLRWDFFFHMIRAELLEIRDGRVHIRQDMSQKIVGLVTQLFSGKATAAPAAPPGAPAPPPLPGATAPPPLPGPLPQTSSGSHPNVARPTIPVAAPVGHAAATNAFLALGIDLGTTYSLVAHVDSQGRPWCIPNAVGDNLTPSVVLFDEGGGVVVGKEAVSASALEPELVADLVKRDMGSKAYRKRINGELLPPEVISSFILKTLMEDAERKLGPVNKAVITVPAYFDEPRRRATMDAGRLAGLEVLDIINEPTAAAIAYGSSLGYLDRYGKPSGDKPLRVLVYDLGGGTFDVTIVEIAAGSFRAIATDGDVFLGGKDWDHLLIDHAAELFRQQHREDPRQNPQSLAELIIAAEQAKKTLTERPKATLFVNHLGTRMKIEVTREQFEEMTAPLLSRTQATTEIVIRQAGLRWSDVDKLLLVGGSCRMPQVSRMLEEVTGKKPERFLALDEAVAHGAAIYADLQLHQRRSPGAPAPFSVTNINSHSLGIVGRDPNGVRRNGILIPKNTALPASVSKVFKTHEANQKSVVVRIVEGESERPDACTQVGVCTIRNLPPNLPAGWPVEVKYSYEPNGRLKVSAKLQGKSASVETEFARENSVSENDMQLWREFVETGTEVVG